MSTRLSKHSEETRQAQQHEERRADNRIGDEGVRGLGDALKTNTTLIELNLDGEQQDHKKHNKRTRQAQWYVE